MSATMRQIAEKSGVSVGVVSRLVRKDPTLQISDERRRKILEVQKELGGLKMQRRRLTRTILLPVDQAFVNNRVQELLTNPLSVYPSFRQTLEGAGFHLHMVPVDRKNIVKSFLDLIDPPAQCDGVLLAMFDVGEKVSDILRKTKFPHVSNDYKSQAEQFDLNTVNVHRTEGVRRALNHLKDLHHRRIGFFGTRGNYSYANYVAAMAIEGLAINECQNVWLEPKGIAPLSEQAREEARGAAGKLLDSKPRATAFICQNDQFALGLVDAMFERGMKPGVDLSLVGFDNIEPYLQPVIDQPMLTTVHNPLAERGARMAELLLNQIIHKQTQIVHERIPIKLVVRSSTGIASSKSCLN